MISFRALFLAFAASGLMAATAAVPLAELIQQSDVVVVATVADEVLAESGSTLMLACERNLSGKLPANGLLAVTFDGSPKSLLGQRGLWFARRTGSGSYRLHAISNRFDFFYPVPPGDLPHPFRYTASMPPGEKVMMEVAASVEFFVADSALAQHVLTATAGLAREETAMVFERFARSSSPVLRAVGVAGLLRHADQNAIARARQHWQTGEEMVQTRSRTISEISPHR